jgi:hypothetical protein
MLKNLFFLSYCKNGKTIALVEKVQQNTGAEGFSDFKTMLGASVRVGEKRSLHKNPKPSHLEIHNKHLESLFESGREILVFNFLHPIFYSVLQDAAQVSHLLGSL